MAGQKFYEGQEFHNPNDPSAPVLVYRGGKFYPKDAQGALTGAPQAKLSPEDAAALKGLVSEVQSRQLLAERARAFMDKQDAGAGIGTGPIYADTPIINHVIPNLARTAVDIFDPKTAARLQSMDAINSATWTALRPSGSGPIRNYEASGWKKAFPSTTNFHDANQDIAERLAGEAQEGARRLQFIQNFIRAGKGGYGDAMAAYAGQQGAPDAPKPAADPRAQANAALKARSAQAGPITIDINGRPVR